jgi:hypothetical protein
MADWRRLDEWLAKYMKLHHDFSAEVLGSSLGVPSWEASKLIQAYLAEQRKGEESQTQFVLKRRNRTRAAVWSVGEKTRDMRRILRQYEDDIRRTFWRAVEPDLQHIADINPLARKAVEAKIDTILEGAFKVLAATLDGATTTP